jgi:hypothetical protein
MCSVLVFTHRPRIPVVRLRVLSAVQPGLSPLASSPGCSLHGSSPAGAAYLCMKILHVCMLGVLAALSRCCRIVTSALLPKPT